MRPGSVRGEWSHPESGSRSGASGASRARWHRLEAEPIVRLLSGTDPHGSRLSSSRLPDASSASKSLRRRPPPAAGSAPCGAAPASRRSPRRSHRSCGSTGRPPPGRRPCTSPAPSGRGAGRPQRRQSRDGTLGVQDGYGDVGPSTKSVRVLLSESATHAEAAARFIRPKEMSVHSPEPRACGSRPDHQRSLVRMPPCV